MMNEMTVKRALGMIGMCRRAGRIATGDEQTKISLMSGGVSLIVIAEDASKYIVSRFTGMSQAEGKPCLRIKCTKAELGGAIGRGDCAVVGICDAGFGKSIRAILETEDMR